MRQTIHAIYEDGVLKPLEKLALYEHQRVWVIIETSAMVGASRGQDADDPLRGIRAATGIPDLAGHFDDYRLDRRQ
jgi:predicted DNA-binding antitoxin AbrB/MazE fold protein